MASALQGDTSAVPASALAAGTTAARREIRTQLLVAVASTCRGQCGSEAAKRDALQLVQAMEALNPTQAPARDTGLLQGEWKLIFASEDVTRSSPFFWGWRQLLEGLPDPNPLSRSFLGTETLSESIFAITDGIPMKTIGEASQTIYNGRLVNRIGVQVWGVGENTMTTTCRMEPSDTDGTQLTLTVESTQAVGSNLPMADQVVFPSETLLGASAKVTMRVTYLDETLRISRNAADGQVFVYSRSD